MICRSDIAYASTYIQDMESWLDLICCLLHQLWVVNGEDGKPQSSSLLAALFVVLQIHHGEYLTLKSAIFMIVNGDERSPVPRHTIASLKVERTFAAA